MPTADYTPTVEELATFLKVRTKSRYGAVVGEFTADTPITATDAAELIAEAVNEVAIAVGSDVPDATNVEDVDSLRKGAKALVQILAAMNVELALVPEQINDPRSAYQALERRFTRLSKVLVEAITEAKGGTGGGESAAGDPEGYGFPSGDFGPIGTTMTEPH